jgi:autotransporter-associated beta strand protein
MQPGAILVSNVSRTYTFSNGVLGGVAPLIKSGSGTLNLVASNSYTGGTVINAGTVALANDTANQYALGTGPVTLNGGTLAMYSNFGTYNNAYWDLVVPAGANGTLNADARCDLFGNLYGSGTLNLNLSNIRTGFHGDWSAFAGQINIIGAGSSGDFRVAPDYSWSGLGNAIVTMSNGAALYYAGNLNSGSGTTVDLGALVGNSTAKIQGGPSSAGARLMTWRIGSRNVDSVFSGTISEQAPGVTTTCITKIGTGVFTLAGNNSYSGPTAINSGSLQIGNGGTTGTLGSNYAANAGTLAFNRSDSVSDAYFGLISGVGNFAQNGSGTFTFTRSQPFTGSTFVNAGKLALTGSGAVASSVNIVVANGALFDVSGTTAGNLTLAGGQTLSGNGAVRGNLIVGNGATLSPGNPLGTLMFSNSLTLAAGSTTLMSVSHSPFTNDIAKVLGGLTNGGTLIVSNAGETALAAGDSFKLFAANSYNGAFTGVNLPILPAGLAWNTNSLNSAGLVSVISIVPTFTAVMAVGTNLVVRGSGGLPNGMYYVLTSTNIALPLSAWNRSLTNFYDSNGNFAFTNAVLPGIPQKFIAIGLP